MNPVAFTIGPVSLYWYGLFFSLGFMACGAGWAWACQRRGLGWVTGLELGFWLILCSVIGARLAFALSHVDYFLLHPAALFQVRKGGMIFYGGIVGGLAAVGVFARRRKIPFLSLLDVAAVGTPLGHAVGRIGCAFNGCCYGITWNGPGAVHLHECLRFPSPLLEVFGNLCIFLVLTFGFRRNPPWGRSAAFYLILYGAFRFSNEFLRGDPRQVWGPLHTAQWLSLLAVVGGVLLLRFTTQDE